MLGESSSVKKPGDLIRALVRAGRGKRIDEGWKIVRFEPGSGNAVAEKSRQRIICPRGELCALNFGGSDALWSLIGSEEHESLAAASAAWAILDLSDAGAHLLRYCRSLDPEFAGIETVSDLEGKIRAIENHCRSALSLLEIERRRIADGHEEAVRLANRIMALRYHLDELIPLWRGIHAGLAGLDRARAELA